MALHDSSQAKYTRHVGVRVREIRWTRDTISSFVWRGIEHRSLRLLTILLTLDYSFIKGELMEKGFLSFTDIALQRNNGGQNYVRCKKFWPDIMNSSNIVGRTKHRNSWFVGDMSRPSHDSRGSRAWFAFAVLSTKRKHRDITESLLL